jgi:hypothetical protein
MLQLADEVGPFLRAHRQLASLGRLLREQDNQCAVLGWSRDGFIDPDVALRVVASVWWYGHHRIDLTQGRSWLEDALVTAGAKTTAVAADTQRVRGGTFGWAARALVVSAGG